MNVVLAYCQTKIVRKCVNIYFISGQMFYLEDKDMVIYLCSPFVRSLKDLEDRKMHLADIPIHDVTRDLLWMELMARYTRMRPN